MTLTLRRFLSDITITLALVFLLGVVIPLMALAMWLLPRAEADDIKRYMK